MLAQVIVSESAGAQRHSVQCMVKIVSPHLDVVVLQLKVRHY